jgi:hypothetical protein
MSASGKPDIEPTSLNDRNLTNSDMGGQILL